MIKPRKGEVAGRIRLDGVTDSDTPSLTLHALDDEGNSIFTSDVGDDGSFSISSDAMASARRIVVAVADADPNDGASTVAIRPGTFAAELERGEVTIAPRESLKLFQVRRCADATIKRCFPWWPVITDLVNRAQLVRFEPGPIGPPILLPPHPRCSPICVGVVEVYRRTCCCTPPVFEPPFFEPPELIPHDPPVRIPEPWPPIPTPAPGPGPDPVPFEIANRVLTQGTVDLGKLNLERDRVALQRLQGKDRHEYLIARPYLWCSCGAGVKVAEGFVGEGGRIHVCWNEQLRFIGTNCHDEYSYVVKQNIGGQTVTIYNGPAAGQWFDADDDDVNLTSYHFRAVTCRDDDFPSDPGMPFVVLQDLGATESHRLRTPLQDGPDSVLLPPPDGGLLGVGADDYALGGDVHLRYHFSESMQGLGARYFRVQVAPADNLGDPSDDFETLAAPAWDTWRVVGTSIVRGSHALGPHSVGGENDLFYIPFEVGAPLLPGEEWQDGQFHAVVDSAQRPEGSYLVRIEVFDAAGTRMEPGTQPFSFRRWIDPTNTLPVPFGALTHQIHTDNRPVVGDIVDVNGPGAGAGDCKFFSGAANADIDVSYRANHPEMGTPSFMLRYVLRIRRGISGANAVAPIVSSTEVGEGLPAVQSYDVSDLLGGEEKCSFAATLDVDAKIHNGFGRLTGLDRHDVAAFAVEQVPFP